MTEELQFEFDSAKESMEHAITHLEDELVKVRAGRATPSMLEGIFVDYYGVNSPLSQVSNISTPDARTLLIQPWEKSMLEPISKAILQANIGLNPQNDGEKIRLSIPVLTEERRKELVKKAKAIAEHAKVSIRNVRRTANEAIKKLQKDGLPEDVAKDAEQTTQNMTDHYIKVIDLHLEKKEKEILTV